MQALAFGEVDAGSLLGLASAGRNAHNPTGNSRNVIDRVVSRPCSSRRRISGTESHRRATTQADFAYLVRSLTTESPTAEKADPLAVGREERRAATAWD